MKQFVASKENLDSVESSLKMVREQTGELEHARELLTIKEMKERGFSACPVGLALLFLVSAEDQAGRHHPERALRARSGLSG